MDFDQALEEALNGRAILFLGAGFSLGAKNSRGALFKTAGSLADSLSVIMGGSGSTDLQDIAEEFLEKCGEAQLAEELLQEFRAVEVAKHHVTIASVPWRRVWTTNYDTAFELASGRSGRPARAVTLSERPAEFQAREFLAVHLNGYVERITSAIGNEIRLTDTSYVTTSVEESAWSGVFRQDLELAKAVFFVGYSIADLDIARILAPTTGLQEKTFLIVGAKPSTRTVTRAAKIGTVQRFDAAWFANQVERKRLRYSPPVENDVQWHCIEPYEPPLLDVAARYDDAVFALVLRGAVDRRLLWNSLNAPTPPYVVRRAAAERSLARSRDSSKIVIAHSGLANGKSLVLESVKGLAALASLPAFSLVRRTAGLRDELLRLASRENPFLLIVDDYANWLDALEFLGNHTNPKMSLVLAARSPINDVAVDRIEEMFATRSVEEIPVDRLSDDELVEVDRFLSHYGLWGPRSGLSRDARISHLRIACRREWQSILVDVFEAPQVRTRFDSLLSALNTETSYRDVLVGILVLTIMNARVSVNLLVDLFGNRVLDRAFKDSDVVRELIDFQRGEVLSHSSAASKFVLGQVIDPNAIVNALAELTRSLDKYVSWNRQYTEILRAMVQFSQLESVLPNRSLAERREAVFRYYERVKNLNYNKTNPQFWLQYAIAALVFEGDDLSRSERYLQSAYAYAARLDGYDTHKMDNHFARLLLKRAAQSGTKDAGLPLFRRARKILFDQIQAERRYYPYRVANALGDFYDAFAGSLSRSEAEEVKNAAAFIRKRIDNVSPDLQSHRYVRECAGTMERIIRLVGASAVGGAGGTAR